MKLTDYKIILASNSPRRKELLSGIDIDYEVKTFPDIDESFPDDLPKEQVAEFLAQKKAAAYTQLLSDETLLLTADTVVVLNNEILGKPVDKEHAKTILRKLSGNTHRVITGVCLTLINRRISFSDTTFVTFGDLSDEEIEYYVEKYNPMDKAGAYGVQEWIGYVAVRRIEGSYFNVMGLPICRICEELKKL